MSCLINAAQSTPSLLQVKLSQDFDDLTVRQSHLSTFTLPVAQGLKSRFPDLAHCLVVIVRRVTFYRTGFRRKSYEKLE